MGWGSAIKQTPVQQAVRPVVMQHVVDWDRLVSLDFETYFDDDYTLRKLNTSEYIRDSRFEALMVGVKIGRKKAVLIPGPEIKKFLQAIPWATHSLLCHHIQFDGFIMSHHYGIQPKMLYCSLSMARGLFSNEIGAGLDEVSKYLGRRGKNVEGVDTFKGMSFKQLFADKKKWKSTSTYCLQDVDEMYGSFQDMLPAMPADEMEIIDHTCRMFTNPVLSVDLPRVEKELAKELQDKEDLLLACAGKKDAVRRVIEISNDPKILGKKAYQGWTPKEIMLEENRKIIASNESFADLLRTEGIDPPVKISPAWFKHKEDDKKYAYAFAKTDLSFTSLLEHPKKRVRDLVECRLSVKSTINETRAGRFLEAGRNGWKLPVYLRYFGAHTGRWSAGNKMNMQNLPRGGELRKSILAPKGHQIVVADSGQIEARVNAWLAGQEDLLDDFRAADAGKDRDAYCKFGDTIYGRKIVKGKDDLERFVSKIAVLGLGYQMGAAKFQNTLALGTMGPPVFFELDQCQKIVSAYRRKNTKIVNFWKRCEQIIEDMAVGREGSYKCISWSKNTLHLPNGMKMKYPNLRKKAKQSEEEWGSNWVYDRKDEEAKIYGGLLCENIVQALARIIVGEQLLIIARKYRVVMTTHDEIVTVVLTRMAKACYEFMLKTMRTPSKWCPDIPLNAEGGFDANYSK